MHLAHGLVPLLSRQRLPGALAEPRRSGVRAQDVGSSHLRCAERCLAKLQPSHATIHYLGTWLHTLDLLGSHGLTACNIASQV